MTRPRRFHVGQFWVAHHPQYPTHSWIFEIVHERWVDGQPYYVALKCDVMPDSLQAVVFDAMGQCVEAGPFHYQFQLVRLSRRKHAVRRTA